MYIYIYYHIYIYIYRENTFLAISVLGQIYGAIVAKPASRRKWRNLHNLAAPPFEDPAHQTTTSPARGHGSTFAKHLPAVVPGILEQH